VLRAEQFGRVVMSARSGGGACVEVRSALWRQRHGRQPWCWFEPHRGRWRTDETGDGLLELVAGGKRS
jgi:hypothetical protein